MLNILGERAILLTTLPILTQLNYLNQLSNLKIPSMAGKQEQEMT